MKVKNLILTARVLSLVFTPFYLPIVGLLALFTFSYMSLLPWQYKLVVLGMVYIFTILFPTLLIHFYCKYQGWNLIQLGARERRMIPYIISILCYFCCYYLMIMMHIPSFMARILLAALAIQVMCAIINIWWKVSTHTAAIGGVLGALVAFSFLFAFNPIGWICLVIIIAGMVGSSRIILMQHSLSQVVVGFVTGMLCGFFTII
ncbi:MAG: hypothetical protein PUF39_07005 [Prevotellaceae bacterium]|nr:hypothetical protein [Prevotellaceae bacterium]